MIRRLALALIVLLATTLAVAKPVPEQFLGYPIGERFTPHHRILAYFEELDRASELVTVQKIGETYEQRPLVLATITSAKNRAVLEDIRRNVVSLANGEGDGTLAKTTPAVVWLGFGVHGNESSSAEAAMLVASALVREPALLENLVVILDPLSNPDGRERYIGGFHRARGVTASSNPDAFEHFEPWPGGRFNHYLIDMNRDWAWASQRETQARVAAYRQWRPQVYVDFHEMFYTSSYFFPPNAKPINANLPSDVEKWLDVFGRANAAEFSRRGWPFFVAESFDVFYPGYGDSWPSLNGAIGMTYEMAGHGRAGSTIEREDGTVLTLADRAQRHFTTAMATVRTAAANREALLRYTYDAARAQVANGKNVFLLVPGSPNFPALVSKLEQQGVRLDMLTAPVSLRATRLDREAAETRTFPAGTVVVDTRQPLGRLANTLLERTAVLNKEFVEAQRERAVADEPDEFYDLTTWSLPLAMNVEAFVTTTPVAGTAPYRKPAPAAFKPAAYGYLVDGLDPALYRLAGRMLAEKIRFSVSETAVTAGERTYARGTLVILESNNAATLEATLAKLVEETGAAVVPLESGWMGGIAFGSDKIRFVRDPKIGIVGGAGVNPTSFGMLWHTLDVDTPIPHSTLQLESLRGLDLHRYKVLVFPDGGYGDRLGKAGIEKLKSWVSDGGTLIAVRGANEFLRGKDVELSKLKPWERPKKKDDEPATDERYNDFRVPGSAFRTTMNERSYLTFGLPRSPAALIEGTDAWLPLAHKVDNILTVDAKDPLISGVAWPESLERIKGSVHVVSERVGRGQVISFASDPHYRLFWRGTLPIFLNAVLYSATF
jgi:Zinc carboxypeptidase